MNIHHVNCFTVSLILSGTLHAQVCSGGVGGGMDATGQECNASGLEAYHSPGRVRAVESIQNLGQAQPADKLVSAVLSEATVLEPDANSARPAQRQPVQVGGPAASRAVSGAYRNPAQ